MSQFEVDAENRQSREWATVFFFLFFVLKGVAESSQKPVIFLVGFLHVRD